MKILIPLAASVLVLGNQAMASNTEAAMNRIAARYMTAVEAGLGGANGRHVEARHQYRHGGAVWAGKGGAGDRNRYRVQDRDRTQTQTQTQTRTRSHDH